MTIAPKPAAMLRHPMFRYGIWGLATAAVTWLAIVSSYSIGSAGRGSWQTPAFAVPLHLVTVLPALPLGLWILLRPKGSGQHKLLGRIWGMLMLLTAIDTLLIREVTGSLSPLHIFSVVTLVSIPLGIWQVRRGNISGHRRAMIGPYIGIAVAGLFALTPGRLLGELLFG